jgi:uncharacterized protein (TIGR00661 family)
MATLIYALSGEGRGHATRAQTVIDALRHEHTIKVYAYGQASELLEPLYRGTDVAVRRIPGLQFHYTERGLLDYPHTVLSAAPYLMQLRERVLALSRELARDVPALVISDFEPLLPRVAARLGVPFISLDHQHFLTAYDLSHLPMKLRWYAHCLSPWVKLYYQGQAHSIVSSFYDAPLAPHSRNVTRVGVLLRPAILNARASVEHGRHWVVYARRHVPAQFVNALVQLGVPVRVYGLGAQPQRAAVTFHAIAEERFVADLATSAALVCTAGNQLVGEALYLGKPVLALPEVGNFEQAINAHFLATSGMGEMQTFARVDACSLRGFMERVERLRANIEPNKVCGNAQALAVVREQVRCAQRAVVCSDAPTTRQRGYVAT